jgi:hypothetical protein
MRPNIHNARNTVAELRSALLSPSPEGLEVTVPALEAAVRDLEAIRSEHALSEHGFVARRELQAFAADLLGVARLIEHGMQFHHGWARVLASAACNYQPNGEPAAAAPVGKLSVQG